MGQGRTLPDVPVPLVGVLLDGLGRQFFGLVRVHGLAPVLGEDTLACFLKIPGLPGDDRVGSRLRGCAGPDLAGDQGGVHGHAPVVVHNAALLCRALFSVRLVAARSWIRRVVPAGGAAPHRADVSVWPPRGPGRSELVGVDRYESLPDGVDGQECVLKGDDTQQAGFGWSGEYHRGGLFLLRRRLRGLFSLF